MINVGDHKAAQLRIVLWGTCDVTKPRIRILRDGLRENGIDLIECRIDIWGRIRDKSQIKRVTHWLALLGRIALAYPVLAWRYLRLPRHDWVLLGYPAIPDIFVIRCLAWLRGARVAMDWFLSAYDTVVEDRKIVGKYHPLASMLWCAEWVAARLPDALFMDTHAHATRMEELFKLRPGSCGRVWVGVEMGAFDGTAAATIATAPRKGTEILFYGQFIPLHGLPTIIEAARRLRDKPIDWLLIGHGQESTRVEEMMISEPLPRLRMLAWVEYENLLDYLRDANICLGIFGTSGKAASVIPNKVFQIIAARKPLITCDSPGIRELVGEGRSDIILVGPGDAEALADAILAWSVRAPAADPGRDALVARFTPAAIAKQCIELLRERSL